MYRLVILSVVVIIASTADLTKRDCGRMFQPESMHCCKKHTEIKDKAMIADELKECMEVPIDPVACEHELCIANKRGFATDDGKLDKVKLEELMTKDLDDKDLLADIKANCINGDINNYGPPQFCDFMKMRHCASMQMMNHCSEWNDFDNCSELRGLVADCVKLFAS